MVYRPTYRPNIHTHETSGVFCFLKVKLCINPIEAPGQLLRTREPRGGEECVTCPLLKMRLDPALGCSSEMEYRVSIQQVLGSISSTKRIIKDVNQDIKFFSNYFRWFVK